MTAVADFTEEERNLLVRLPRWIVANVPNALSGYLPSLSQGFTKRAFFR